MGMLFISRLSCDLQAVSGGLSYSVWDFSAQMCVKWVPCCMVNPVPSCHVGSAAHLACGCAGTVVLPGHTELAVYAAWLPDSFLAVAVLSGAVPS